MDAKTKSKKNIFGKKDCPMLSFVLNGKNRIITYLQLLKEPCYAYEIARKENLTVSAVLRTIKDLKEAEVITCLNPEDRNKKIYCLTEKALLFRDEIRNKALLQNP
ncbi:MAG: winged helix-turn-helix domain-containing protein [Candidatus Thorarchaeota archaeon]